MKKRRDSRHCIMNAKVISMRRPQENFTKENYWINP
uniref:Odorant-binding protein n=1 Tax=Anoplophora chinensis TaxID=217632 RepID=A0A2H4ZB08_ANOCN|nr:odorant-binding protein [Anoplophora chinensis]